MSTEIGTLVAKFTADVSGFEKGRKTVESGMKSTATQAQTFSNAIHSALGRVNPQAAELSGSFSEVSSAAGGLVTAVGAGAIAVTAMGVISFEASKKMYELASSAAEVSANLGHIADKVNFSVRTLSGLGVAAEASGGSIQGMATALGIFDRNIESVAQGDEKLSKLFKGLKIDATNNEVAFRQVADILMRLGGTSQQTALAMALFGRSGKDVLGVIKEADGNVEEFIKKMEALGIVIDDKTVTAAKAFDKQMVTVKAQLSTVGRQLGQEFMPLVQQSAENLSNWLAKNQGEIRKTI